MAKASKSTLIKRETKRLKKIFEGIDENKMATVEPLIERAAFITVSLQEIEKQIEATGWVEPYKNGKNQSGVKQSAVAAVHISLTKNLTVITKQLLELVPPAQKKNKLAEMMNR